MYVSVFFSHESHNVPNEEKRNCAAPRRLHVFMHSREDRNSLGSGPEFLIVPTANSQLDNRGGVTELNKASPR